MRRALITRVGLVALGAAVVWMSCGDDGVTGEVGAAGGELCLPDQRACLKVPLGGLERQVPVRISADGEKPPAALGESFDISATDGQPLTFLKPATVTLSMDTLDPTAREALPSESLLRVFTRQGDEWVPLGAPVVDRVRNVVSGTTLHLSPFVLLRADRLPDGGLPVDSDAGVRDGGSVVVVPPFDAGPPDAGPPDAGPPDAGPPDAGEPDAGPPDAGPPDAGPPDAGPPDAGEPDAGPPDAGPPDAGEPDAGEPDAGPPDAGEPDAGAPDAGDDDDAGEPDSG